VIKVMRNVKKGRKGPLGKPLVWEDQGINLTVLLVDINLILTIKTCKTVYNAYR
jgi:hypothetical protein